MLTVEDRLEHEVSVARDRAMAKQNEAVANFFQVATELLKLCAPLVKQAVAEQIKRGKV